MKIHLVKSFTQNPTQGNPAGVVLETTELSEQHMQQISTELGFAESVFVFPSQKVDYTFRFFTPTEETGLCVHASLAAYHMLLETHQENRDSITVETKKGLYDLKKEKDGKIWITLEKPTFFETEHEPQIIASLLGITKEEFLESPLQTVSVGTPKLMIPIESLDSLLAIKPDLEGMKDYCRNSEVRGFYPFVFETIEPDSDLQARQFNPLAGINEDPITGVAAGALGAYLKHCGVFSPRPLVIEQGYSMNQFGKMFVDIANEKIKVGGFVVNFDEKIFD